MDNTQNGQNSTSENPHEDNKTTEPHAVSHPDPNDNLPKQPQKIDFVFIVLLAITLSVLVSALVFVAADINAGVLGGTPETGWGIAIALFFFGPLLLIFGLLTFFRARRLKSNNTNIGIGKYLIYATVGVLLLGGGQSIYSYIDHKQDEPYRKIAEQKSLEYQQQKLADAPKAIDEQSAIELIKDCKLKGFYFGDIIHKDGTVGKLIASSESKIVVVGSGGKPTNIQIGSEAESALVPEAQKAEKACPNFKVWGD